MNLQDQEEKLRYILDFSWEIYIERLISSKISLNLESSMQLHYASIINNLGELLIVKPDEIFNVELEHAYENTSKYIDIQCSYNNVKAALELKCFRKGSNRAKDIDMYDALKDIERLDSFKAHKIKKFICLSDDISYLDGKHTGHAGIVSIKDGRKIASGTKIVPSWIGKWKNKSRDNPIVIKNDIHFKWIRKDKWYYVIIDLYS